MAGPHQPSGGPKPDLPQQLFLCMFLSVFDEHNSFADQQHVGYGFLSVVLKDTFKVTSEIGLPISLSTPIAFSTVRSFFLG